MMSNLLRILILLGLVVPPGVTFAASAEERLQADHAAWRDARAAYENRVASGRMAQTERRDYAAFLDELAARVVRGCERLRVQGGVVPRDVNCPAPDPAASHTARDERVNAPSGGADRAALDAELGASLGQFDELLLREQDRVRAEKPRVDSRDGDGTASASAGGASASAAGAQGGSGASAGTGGAGTQGASGGQGSTASAGGVSGQGMPGGLPGGQGGADSGGQGGDPGQGGLGGPAGSGTGTTTPADLPDPSGDDVVARQLREAAEAERDPELRERLWDEYRRYRRGIN